MGTRLAVYCGSNSGRDSAHVEVARELGTALAGRGIGLVYGGGDVGLMGEIAGAALAAGGEVIGVIPEHLIRAEVAHHDLTELRVVDSMHTRKAVIADLVSGFLVLPGGFGTLDEVLEVLTWNQLRLIAKPVVFVDPSGFYEPLFSLFDRAVDEGFVRPVHRALAQRAISVDDAIALATSPAPATPHKWLDLDSAPGHDPR